MDVKALIRTIPHFPKEGIMFRDITSLLQDPKGFRYTVDQFVERYIDKNIDVIAGIESRGFIIASAMAYAMGKSLVPIRKKGKLPGKVISQDYQLEYGTDTIEIHDDAIQKSQRVLLVDDLLATGGTAEGAIKLIERLGGDIVETAFIVDLPELNGREKLKSLGHDVFFLCEFEGH